MSENILTTHPHMVKFFKNPLDTEIYSYGSHAKTIFVCPNCGDEQNRQIKLVITRGYRCPLCDKGISRPNKLLRSLLKQLPVKNTVFEYSPEWANGYKYDAYFEYQKSPYIVEMDGDFHYKSVVRSGQVLVNMEDVQRRDQIKNELAEQHNIKLIRINCNNIRLNKIVQNIKDSLLGSIFDLENIDWEKNYYNDPSTLKLICDCYNNSNLKSAASISKELKMSVITVRSYLNAGDKLGLCKYNPKEAQSSSVPIKITYLDTGKIDYYNSCKECVCDLNSKGISVNEKTLRKHRQDKTEYKGFICEIAS